MFTEVWIPFELVSEIARYKKAEQSYSSFVLIALRNKVERRNKVLSHWGKDAVPTKGKLAVPCWGKAVCLHISA